MRTIRSILFLAILGVVLAACSGSAAAMAPPQAGGGETVGDGVAPAGTRAPPRARRRTANGIVGTPDDGQGGNAAVDDARIIRTGSMDLEVTDVAGGRQGGPHRDPRDGRVRRRQQRRDGRRDAVSPRSRIASRPTAGRTRSPTCAPSAASRPRSCPSRPRPSKSPPRSSTSRPGSGTSQASETALQGIAAKATKISDVLEIQAQLTAVRGQIEQLTAQLKDLNDRAAFATLTARFAVPVVAVQVAQSEWEPGTAVDEASASLISTLQGLTDAGIWFVIVWLPILLVLGVVAVIGIAIARRMGVGRRDLRPPAPPAPPAEAAVRGLTLGRSPLRPGPWLAPPAGPSHAWHDARMTDQGERYDRMAAGYDRWWAPVLAPERGRRCSTASSRSCRPARSTLLDVGIGTGQPGPPRARAGGRRSGSPASTPRPRWSGPCSRWPTIASPAADRDRLDARTALADALPFEDGSFDAAMSSFVFQLVPSRARAFREIHRVLRPGGTLAYVTWLTDRSPFAPDRVFDALLDEYGFDDAGGQRSGRRHPVGRDGRGRAAPGRLPGRRGDAAPRSSTGSRWAATSRSSSSSTRRRCSPRCPPPSGVDSSRRSASA